VTKQLNVLVVTNPKEPAPPLMDRMPEFAVITEGSAIEAFSKAAATADVIFSWGAKRDLMEQLLAQTPNLKWIHSRSAGLDSLLFPALIESPVPLTNGRGVFSQSLGEFVLAAVLYFAKDFRRMICNQEAGRWEQFNVHEISGQTMGIVGYGDIGRACAWRAKAMGMKVLAVRRHPEQSAGDQNVEHVYGFDGLHEMIRQCDYVVAAAPLTPETKSLINTTEFAAMKPSAIILNVGRGPVIDEPAMLAALQSGKIRGAGLDVFTVEPLPEGHPFYSMDNVLLSPHCADNTQDWLEQAMLFFYRNLDRFQKGEPLENVVDKRAGY
jgi:phosphoglycerate dehydrogenase-like enzyme